MKEKPLLLVEEDPAIYLCAQAAGRWEPPTSNPAAIAYSQSPY